MIELQHDIDEYASFDLFSDYLFEGFGRVELRENMGLYVQSRLMTIPRKNHEAAGIYLAENPEEADAIRQRLNRATLAPWSNKTATQRLGALNHELLPHAHAWLFDVTSFPKKGTKSPGVARQYCGELGKRANCQQVISLHLAAWNAALPMIMELYLPEEWTEDPERCREAGIPEEVEFRTRTEMALDQIDALLDAGFPRKTVIADTEFGVDQEFRQKLRARRLDYMLQIRKNITVERPHCLTGRTDAETLSVSKVAELLPKRAYKTMELRDGTKGTIRGRFAALRVRTAQVPEGGGREEKQWLLIEQPSEEEEPTHFWLSSLPPKRSLRKLAKLSRLRWRVERNYQDLKQEIGLGEFQGRKWRSFHHHLTLCMAAMTYLAIHRRVFPPQPLPFGRGDEAATRTSAPPRARPLSDLQAAIR